MDFEKAVSLVGTVTDLRRIASDHVTKFDEIPAPKVQTLTNHEKDALLAAH
jgi:hypothetical protein